MFRTSDRDRIPFVQNPLQEGDSLHNTAIATTVLHIEDDPLWSEVTAQLLSGWPDINLMETVATGCEGIAQCLAQKPTVVILDLGLPDLDGFLVWDRLLALPYPPRILLLTSRADEALLYRLGLGGIGGLIWKSGHFAQHLRPAVAALAAGNSYFPPEVTEAIRKFRGSPEAFFKILSPWELRLVSLLGVGRKDEFIAVETGLSCGTIRNHWHNIAKKLGLQSRHDLREWTRSKGFWRGTVHSAPRAK